MLAGMTDEPKDPSPRHDPTTLDGEPLSSRRDLPRLDDLPDLDGLPDPDELPDMEDLCGSDEPPMLRLRGPDELVEVVPYLIGFTPVESLVIVSVINGGRRIGLSLRADLQALRHGPLTLGACRTHLRHSGAEEVLLLVYTTAHPPLDLSALPERTLVARVEEQLQKDGLVTRDSLLVVDDRWWSYHCRQPRCCPPTGNRRPAADAPSAVAAAAAVAGLTVVSDREALNASLAPEEDQAPLAAAASQASSDWQERDAGRARRAWRLSARKQLRGEQRIDDETAALLLAGLARPEVRDACLRSGGKPGAGLAHGAEALLRQLVRRASAPFDAAPATMLAWYCWDRGDGAMARIAIERALASVPDYPLAVLVEQMLNAGMGIGGLSAMLDTADGLTRR
jgi:hypothetical protein